MATPDATLTLALDDVQVQAGFDRVVKTSTQSGEAAAQGFTRAAESSENLLVSSHRVSAQIREVAQVMASGGSAADTFSAALEGVEKSLHLPLGALAGLGIGALLIQQMADAVQKAEELHQAILQAVNIPNGDFSTLEDLQTQLANIRKQTDDLRSSMQGWKSVFLDIHQMGSKGVAGALEDLGAGNIAGALGQLMGGAAAQQAVDKSEEESLKKAQTATTWDIAKKYAADASDVGTQESQGDFEAQKDKLTRDYKEQLGTLQKNLTPGADPGALKAYEAAQTALGQKFQEQYNAIQRREDAAKREVDLARQLIEIRQSGDHVEERSAQARLDKAKADFNEATPYEQKSTAGNAVADAEAGLDAARRATLEKERQVKLEKEIGNINLPELQKESATLQAERDSLYDKLSSAKPDDVGEIQAQINANWTRTFQLNTQIGAHGIETERSQIESGTTSDTIQAKTSRLKQLMELEQQARDLNRSPDGTVFDESVEAQHIANIAEMGAELKKIGDDYAAELDAARDQTAEMGYQLDGAKSLVDQARIELQYREKISAAMREGKTALADEYRNQMNTAIMAVAVAGYAGSNAPPARVRVAEDTAAAVARDMRDSAGRGGYFSDQLQKQRRKHFEKDLADIDAGAPLDVDPEAQRESSFSDAFHGAGAHMPAPGDRKDHDWGDFMEAFHREDKHMHGIMFPDRGLAMHGDHPAVTAGAKKDEMTLSKLIANEFHATNLTVANFEIEQN